MMITKSYPGPEQVRTICVTLRMHGLFDGDPFGPVYYGYPEDKQRRYWPVFAAWAVRVAPGWTFEEDK